MSDVDNRHQMRQPSRVMEHPRFATDRTLEKLARLLRMFGHDVTYLQDSDPESIAKTLAKEHRTLLTRDRRLAQMLAPAQRIESSYPFHQAREVFRQYGTPREVEFPRCLEDNTLLIPPMDRAEEESTEPHARPFFICPTCDRPYWQGSYIRSIKEVIQALADDPLILHEGHDDEDHRTHMLEPLLDLHQAMEILFVRHRLALMRVDTVEAMRTFHRFAQSMRIHVRQEDELVLPVYAKHSPAGGFERGGSPELFKNEHEKITQHLTRIEEAMNALIRSTTNGDQRALGCLELLDREKVFVDLLEHHDHRERLYLYPVLERILRPYEKFELLEQMVRA